MNLLKLFCIFPFYSHCICYVLAQTKQAIPTFIICKSKFCSLELAHISCCIWNIFKKDIWLIHCQRFFIIFNEMICCFTVKNFKISKPYYPFWGFFVGIIGKSLIAGDILPCNHILRKSHGWHVCKQISNRFSKLLHLLISFILKVVPHVYKLRSIILDNSLSKSVNHVIIVLYFYSVYRIVILMSMIKTIY